MREKNNKEVENVTDQQEISLLLLVLVLAGFVFAFAATWNAGYQAGRLETINEYSIKVENMTTAFLRVQAVCPINSVLSETERART